MSVPKALPAAGRQQRHLRRLHRPRRLLAGADAGASRTASTRRCTGPERHDGLHDDGRDRVSRLEPGITFTFLKDRRASARRSPTSTARADGQDLLESRACSRSCGPSRCSRSAPARPPDPGPVRVSRSPASTPQQVYEIGRQADGEAVPVPGLPDGLVGLLQQHAEPRHRAPARPGQDVRRLRGADPRRCCATPTRRTTST